MGDITLIRGDVYSYRISKTDADDVKVDFVSGDKVIFSVKKTIRQDTPLVTTTSTTIEDGDIILKLSPEITNIDIGDYYYDISYENSDDEPVTLSKGKLTIDWDITRPTV